VSLPAFAGPRADFGEIQLNVTEFGSPLFRTHGIGRGPTSAGKAGVNRFDAPDDSYKVLYLGADPYCAFIEAFGHVPGTRVVTTEALRSKAMAQLHPQPPLRLIDLTESGALVRIGADARLFSAEYNVSQSWSKALHDHPARAQGLLYRSRLDPARTAIALFLDRKPKLVELSRQVWFAAGPQRLLLAEIAEHYRIELVETRSVVARRPARSVAKQERLLPED
jgi:hypothetical protein